MPKRKRESQSLVPVTGGPDAERLLGDLRGLIDAARDQIARAVNAGLVLLYWGIGERIRRDILGEQRAAYGEQIVQRVSAQLTAEYGKGFSRFALSRMVRFAELFPDRQIVAALSQQLGWSHFMELGGDFAFVARQKRIPVDGEDYYLDLLFYHRRLRRLVAVELKLGRFQAADKGQMELYLRWLEEHERRPGEETPLGLILCAEKSAEHVELLRLEESGIRLAEYLTELPPRDLLERKLEEAIRLARHRLAGPFDHDS